LERGPIKLRLGAKAPWDHPRHEPQCEFLKLLDLRVPGHLIAHAVAGRAGGKSLLAVLWMLYSCLVVNPGCVHLWTEPTYQDCFDVFKRIWDSVVPKELYTWNLSHMSVTLFNGSVIDVRSRQIANQKKDPFQGPEYAGMVWDEARKDPNQNVWDLALAAVRCPKAQQLWAITVSTPRRSTQWYYNMVVKGDDHVVTWTSEDNPHLVRGYADTLAKRYSPEKYAQDVLAQWVAQSGRIWRGWSDEPWTPGNNPAGNIHPHKWGDTDHYYTLAVDLGIRSSWLVIQSVGGVDVVVAEFQPNDEGAQQTLARVDATYGRPMRVIVGSDINTRSIGDASRPARFFRNRWYGIEFDTPMGNMTDKQWQHDVLSGRILNTKGERRFCVSSSLVSHDDTSRGILDVMQSDQWPERAPRAGEFMPKDKSTTGLEDTRDAALYFAICKYPPDFTEQGSFAA
jgi:hypothetical protein